MKVGILEIADRGIANKERLELSVAAFTDLCFFAVFDTVSFPNATVSNFPKHTFWFPSTKVSPGDHVILYTGPGARMSERCEDGGVDHYFYWGLRQTIWGSPVSRVVLLEILSWETSQY